MKKILSALLILTLIFGCTLALSSCKKGDEEEERILDGTYVYEEGSNRVSYTFNGNRFATEMNIGDTYEYEGTYKIEGSMITFTLEAEDGDPWESVCDFAEGDGYIEIDGQKYEKK